MTDYYQKGSSVHFSLYHQFLATSFWNFCEFVLLSVLLTIIHIAYKMDTRKKWLHNPNEKVPRSTKYRRKIEMTGVLGSTAISMNEAMSYAESGLETARGPLMVSASQTMCTSSTSTAQTLSSNSELFDEDFVEYNSVNEEPQFETDLDEEAEEESCSEHGEEDSAEIPENIFSSHILDFATVVETFAHRFRLSDLAIDSLLQLLHLSFGLNDQEKKRLPNSVYKLKRKSKALSEFQTRLGWLCTGCEKEICCPFSDRETPNDYFYCGDCHILAESKDSYYVTLSVERTLKFLLTNNTNFQDAALAERCKHSSDKIHDICCGTVHKAILDKIGTKNSQPSVLTIMFNTDGAPVFSSSKCSVWPILLTINELPPIQRKNHVLCVGLWFGSEKPKFDSFLSNFIAEMKYLEKYPIEWSKNENIVKTKVVCIAGLADSVARPVLQNLIQFNGLYGCQCCEHPGESVKKNAGYVRAYNPMVQHQVRSDENRNEYAMRGSPSAPIKGVKGPSCLSKIPFFDVIEHMPVDYMHACLLGVVRTFTTIWFSPSHSSNPYSLKSFKDTINYKLVNTSPHGLVTRTPRTIDDMAFWKAHEWKIWLLYYSPILLKSFWPEDIYENWCLLSHSMHILSRPGITKLEIQVCRTNICAFAQQIHSIYGIEFCSYNLHILTHLCDFIERYGPLFGFSLFPFENYNQFILKSHSGTQAVPSQMVKYYIRELTLKNIKVEPGNKLADFHKKLTNPEWEIHQKLNAVNICDLGLTTEDLSSFTQGRQITSILQYSRYQMKSFVIQSKSYFKSTKRDSSWVTLSNGTVMSIHSFLKLRMENLETDCAIGDVYEKANANLSNTTSFEGHIFALCGSKTYAIVPVSVINEPIMYMSNNNTKYCLLFPNYVETRD